ncbi:DUF4326 domain-containing protein [Mesorhizobium wenxiniae]
MADERACQNPAFAPQGLAPANTVKVDRSTKWGNPFLVGNSGGVYS